MQVHPQTSVSDVAHYLSSWTPKIEDNIWKNLIELIQNTNIR